MIKAYILRIAQLVCGLAVSSLGITMMLQSNIGSEPWSVFHQGIAHTFGLSYGMASILVGTVVIGIAVICKESFGLGTIGDAFLCGIFIDWLMALKLIPLMSTLRFGILMLLLGLEILTLGAWMYMKSALGAGPRDSLMIAIARRTGRSIGACRAVVDITVVFVGWCLGGQVGIGTLISALGLGAFFNFNFNLLRFDAAAIHQENIAETLFRVFQKK